MLVRQGKVCAGCFWMHFTAVSNTFLRSIVSRTEEGCERQVEQNYVDKNCLMHSQLESNSQSCTPQLNCAFCEVDIKALKQVDELFDELVAWSQVITPATQKSQKIQINGRSILFGRNTRTQHQQCRILKGAPMALFFAAGLS